MLLDTLENAAMHFIKYHIPATTASFLMVRLTIMMASCNDRSVSSRNCSAPPLRISVHVFAAGHPARVAVVVV